MQECVYQKPMQDVDELKQRLIETWSRIQQSRRVSSMKPLINGEIVLMRVSKPTANTLKTFNCQLVIDLSFAELTFKAYITEVMSRLHTLHR